MSIIIAAISQDLNSLYFYGDKRLSTTDPNGKSTHLHDEITKIFKIKEDLFIGFTGWYEYAMVLKDKILENKNYSVGDIINIIQNIPVDNRINLNTIIAGKNETGKLFIFSRDRFGNFVNKVGNIFGSIVYSIATVDDKSEIKALEVFKEILGRSNYNFHAAITQAISEVSFIDPSVSVSYDFFELRL